jgi:ribosomal protein S18 acetylase RimI-like enzyme
MADWIIAPVNKTHDRSQFSCGHKSLDNFLRVLVTQYEKRRLARTYVATEPDSAVVAGYYTISTGGLDPRNLPNSMKKKLPKHQAPTVHLGRLAVDANYRGRRLGETLLLDAIKRAFETGERIGVFGVEVWAIDESANAFYQKYGFVELADHSNHLLLSLKTAELARDG